MATYSHLFADIYPNYAKNGIVVIAEIGVNHNGSIDIAKELIDVAHTSGANIVKFQTFTAQNLVSKSAPQAEYQKNNNPSDSTLSQYDMIKQYEFTKDQFKMLKEYAESLNMMFMSTPFDNDSVSLLNDIGVDIFKIGSGDCDNIPLLKAIIKTQKPVIISTGMTSGDDIGSIVAFMNANDYRDKYMFLHCISAYPAPDAMMNMACVANMRDNYGVPIGFSDHTTTSIASLLAVGQRASCIEKHVTLDNNMAGPDHKASLNPVDFKEFVTTVRIGATMMGDGIKRCMPCEENVRMVAKRCLKYGHDMSVGDIITEDDIQVLRPCYDIDSGDVPPINIEAILGKPVMKNCSASSTIKYSDMI